MLELIEMDSINQHEQMNNIEYRYMKMQRKISYETPEDSHQGTIINATLNTDTKNGKQRENLRLTIKVDPIEDDPMHDYRVRMDYWGNQNETLVTDMHRLLGPDVLKLTNDDNEIVPERLSMLEGKRVRFDVTHELRPGFEIAYRKVQNLRPIRDIGLAA